MSRGAAIAAARTTATSARRKRFYAIAAASSAIIRNGYGRLPLLLHGGRLLFKVDDEDVDVGGGYARNARSLPYRQRLDPIQLFGGFES